MLGINIEVRNKDLLSNCLCLKNENFVVYFYELFFERK